MSQAQLAHLSGRSVTVISQIERGMRCTPDTAERLSAILGCSAAELLR
jgi:transcriptional regulator with XRE-family HTH domain